MRALRQERCLLALVAVAAVVYAVFSLLDWYQLNSGGFDLGIFDQTVWHYSRFELPANSVRGYDSIWGDHFSPILAVLAPLYWVWSDPRSLLLAQAVLLAGAAIPIHIYARERLGRAPALLLAGAYLVFWGVQAGLNFDFHELAFAPVLLAALLLAARRERWWWFSGLLVALLCVKEDQSIVAVFLGLYLLSLRHWRAGAATIAAGVVWYVLTVGLLIPHYAPGGQYQYFNYRAFGDGAGSALWTALTSPKLVLTTAFGNDRKLTLWLFLLAPFLGLALFSRTLIVMVPLLAQRFLSDTPAYWSTEGQYTLAIAALLFIATADGAATLGLTQRRATAAMALVLAVNIGFSLSADRDFADLAKASSYRLDAGVPAAKRAIAAVPDRASVAATDDVIARLAHRRIAAEISPRTGDAGYVIAEVFDRGRDVVANGGFAAVSKYVDARLTSHVPVFYEDGWLVLGPSGSRRTDALPPTPGAQRLRELGTRWGAGMITYAQDGGAVFRRAQAALAAELAREAPARGCRGLRDAAAYAVDALGRAVQRQPEARITAFLAADGPGYVTRYAALCGGLGPLSEGG